MPLAPGTDTVSVLAEEDDLELSGTMVRQGFEQMQGRRFTRWSGSGNVGTVRIGFPGNGDLPRWVLPALIVVLVLPMIWATRKALARA